MLRTFRYEAGFKDVPESTFPTPLPSPDRTPIKSSKSLKKQYRPSGNPFSRAYSPKKSVSSQESSPDSAISGVRTPSVPNLPTSSESSLPALRKRWLEKAAPNPQGAPDWNVASFLPECAHPRLHLSTEDELSSLLENVSPTELIPAPLNIPARKSQASFRTTEQFRINSLAYGSGVTRSGPSLASADDIGYGFIARLVRNLEKLDIRMEEHLRAKREKKRAEKERKEKKAQAKADAKAVNVEMRAQIAQHRAKQRQRSDLWKQDQKLVRMDERLRNARMKRALEANRRIDVSVRQKRVSTLLMGTYKIHAGITKVGKRKSVKKEDIRVSRGYDILGREVFEGHEQIGNYF